jgi:hypothetical protein
MIDEQPICRLRIGTRVRMTGTGDPEIEVRSGTIVGLPLDYGYPLYTIHLDTPCASGERAASFPKSCIVRLSNHA